jgi:hypothetical protein
VNHGFEVTIKDGLVKFVCFAEASRKPICSVTEGFILRKANCKECNKYSNESTKEDEEFLTQLENTFDGVNRKTGIFIELMICMTKFNSKIHLFNEDNCLAADPWRFDTSKLRRNAFTCLGLSSLRNANNLIINEIMKSKVDALLKDLPTSGERPDLHLKRIGASKFAGTGQVDHNETNEG